MSKFKIKNAITKEPYKENEKIYWENFIHKEYFHGRKRIDPGGYEWGGKYGEFSLRQGINGSGNTTYTVYFDHKTNSRCDVMTRFNSIKEMFAYLNA